MLSNGVQELVNSLRNTMLDVLTNPSDLKLRYFKGIFLLTLLFVINGNVEPNPGSKKNISKFLSCFHWNIHIISTHSKLAIFSAYNSINKYNITPISKTYLDL